MNETVINVTWDEKPVDIKEKVAGRVDEVNERKEKVKVLNKEKGEKGRKGKNIEPRKKTS